MQNAKDSFYMALRTRLATINPERTILLRGAVRPGILAEEAEAPFSQLPNDVFVLRWLGLGVDFDLSSTMVAEQCEVIYQSCGTQSFGGLDRGRLQMLDEPDALHRVVRRAVDAEPACEGFGFVTRHWSFVSC